MNLAVLIFRSTYVCKHESKHKNKHIEPKPTQKNCSNVHMTSQFCTGLQCSHNQMEKWQIPPMCSDLIGDQ